MPKNATASSPKHTSTAPYSRRHPQSSRQQFSACGACRIRRVRCDLKDLTDNRVVPLPTCSNCSERGLKCVDEYAEIKAVKHLRRGRRLQQVEAVYGRLETISQDDDDFPIGPVPPSIHTAAYPPAVIPQLKPAFFSSPFWRYFCYQRPILDPHDYPARFLAHASGRRPLDAEGRLVAMMLVVWAASFGVDENGIEGPIMREVKEEPTTLAKGKARKRQTSGSSSTIAPATPTDIKRIIAAHRKRLASRMTRMLREVLALIDGHSITRRPTWDGVRVLLMLLPLLPPQSTSTPLSDLAAQERMDRLALREIAFSQVRMLAETNPPASSGGGGGVFALDSAVADSSSKARVFWYAYMVEGMTTGLTGGRVLLTKEDLDLFQSTLPPVQARATSGTLHSPLSPLSPCSPNFAHHLSSPIETVAPMSTLMVLPPSPKSNPGSSQGGYPDNATIGEGSKMYQRTHQHFVIPLRISTVCREIHALFHARDADVGELGEIWEELDACWFDLDDLKPEGTLELHGEELEKWIAGWQLIIFECFASVVSLLPKSSTGARVFSKKCADVLPKVLALIRQYEHTDLMLCDSGLLRGTVWRVGVMVAEGASEEDEQNLLLCMHALESMRWGLVDGGPGMVAGKEASLRKVWEVKKEKEKERKAISTTTTVIPPVNSSAQAAARYIGQHAEMANWAIPTANVVAAGGRPYLAPLNTQSLSKVTTRPNTGSSTLSASSLPTSTHASSAATIVPAATTSSTAHGWFAYTPPGTATSSSTTNSAIESSSPCNIFRAQAQHQLLVRPVYDDQELSNYPQTVVSSSPGQFTYDLSEMGDVGLPATVQSYHSQQRLHHHYQQMQHEKQRQRLQRLQHSYVNPTAVYTQEMY